MKWHCTIFLLVLCAWQFGCSPGGTVPGIGRNVVVYKEDGRFAGWPANNGCWAWGNEIVVGFVQGYYRNNLFGHDIDESRPQALRFARSLDGGETWNIEVPSFLDEHGKEPGPTDCPGGIDFTHPDFAMALRMVSSNRGHSRFYCSTDRCRTWSGPFKLPSFGRTSVSARTDYIVLGPNDAMAFITAAKDNAQEGRPLCIRTTDGGKTWNFVSWICPEPCGFAIMPSTVQVGPESLLTAIRCKEGLLSSNYWIDIYRSDDLGNSWQYLNRPTSNMGGNPASMIKLADGRIALTYGYREVPYGVRARVSADSGQTWGDEIVIRVDGGCWDLGYPRSIQRSDGKIVTIYYFNDAPDQERYIAASIWDPPAVSQ